MFDVKFCCNCDTRVRFLACDACAVQRLLSVVAGSAESVRRTFNGRQHGTYLPVYDLPAYQDCSLLTFFRFSMELSTVMYSQLKINTVQY